MAQSTSKSGNTSSSRKSAGGKSGSKEKTAAASKNTATFSTALDLQKDTRGKLIGMLQQHMADNHELYDQTKVAHWNVKGENFWQLHKLFDELAEMIPPSWAALPGAPADRLPKPPASRSSLMGPRTARPICVSCSHVSQSMPTTAASMQRPRLRTIPPPRTCSSKCQELSTRPCTSSRRTCRAEGQASKPSELMSSVKALSSITCLETRIGQSVRAARASASDGRASSSTSMPLRSRITWP